MKFQCVIVGLGNIGFKYDAHLKNSKKQLTHSGHFEFFGLKMSQIPEALIKISTLLQISQPTKIIEFGTGYGGFSHLLNIYCNKNKIDFISYDAQDLIQDFNQHLKLKPS